jgi:hypothetical protein
MTVDRAPNSLDLDWLLRVRVVVARCGEADCANWWNSQGQLGPRGADVLRRGFPRTHHFAQARSVFAAAANRCSEVFDSPDAVTLWRLPAALEEEFDQRWELWLDAAQDWGSFFDDVARMTGNDVVAQMRAHALVDDACADQARALAMDAGGRGVRLPDAIDSETQLVSLLALGFGRGEVGRLVVPYARSSA